MKNMLFALACLMFVLVSCDSPMEPEPGPPYEFQVMYERIFPVINPDEADVDTECAAMMSTAGGGQNSSRFNQVEENRWVATFFNVVEDGQRYVFLPDKKIVPLTIGECIPNTGRNLYMRGMGQDWVFLANVKPAQICGGGEWAVVYLRRGKVEIPNQGRQ